MMKRIFVSYVTLLIALSIVAQNNVITYSATEKLPETTSEYWEGLHINAFTTAITSHEFSNGNGTITFADDVTTIGNHAFYECTYLTSVTIPNSVTTIGYYAFNGCSGLMSIVIPNSVTTIENSAFFGCTSLPIIDNLRYADTYLVEAVDKTLSSYTIKDGTKWIGYSAFEYCSGLTSITIPNSVTTIGDYAFYCCSSLTSITIPNSVTTIGKDAFDGCSGLTSITIPNSVTTIGSYAFRWCTGLTDVSIPNSVTTIGEDAFDGCSGLTSITIPNSVTTIGERAFAFCNGLKDVSVAWTSKEQLPSMGEGIFEYIADLTGPSDATLHIPKGTKSIYETADIWKEFGRIAEEETRLIEIQDTKHQTLKYLRNGQLIINRNGEKYSVMGERIR